MDSRSLLRRAVAAARSAEAMEEMLVAVPPLAGLPYPHVGSWRTREMIGELSEPVMRAG